MKKLIFYFIIIPLLIVGITISILRQKEHKDATVSGPQAIRATGTGLETSLQTATSSIESGSLRKTIIKYTVKQGDTIGAIAEQFNISVATILAENNLSATSMIKPGDELSILPFSGISYKVKNGDTIPKIAIATGATENNIIEANGISANMELKAGQSLLIPGATIKTSSLSASAAAAPKKIIANTSTAKPTTVKITSTGSSGVTWASSGLRELYKIPSSVIRSAVKTKITNYAKSHSIKVITKEVYLSIQI